MTGVGGGRRGHGRGSDRRRATRTALVVVGGISALVAGCSGSTSTPAGPGTTHRTPAPTVQDAATTVASGPTSGPASFTILAAGDLLAHQSVNARARANARGAGDGQGYDFAPMLARIAPQITGADLALCHVETPLSADDTALSGFPRFNSPHELATALAGAGFDGCSTASNHSVDQGLAGVTATLDALDAVHLGHAGTARSAPEKQRVDTYTVHGVRVAHLAYTYGTNGLPVPAAAPWSVNLTSVPAILADARRAREQGAAFVVVSMHWGTEYQVEPTPQEQEQAAALLASPDVDLILGDHVHVQQPVRRIGDKYVVYGLGNLLSNQSPAAGLRPQTQDGSLITVHVHGVAAPAGSPAGSPGGSPDGVTYRADRVTWTPTYCPVGAYVVQPVVATLADPTTTPALRDALRASLARTTAIQTTGVAVRSDLP